MNIKKVLNRLAIVNIVSILCGLVAIVPLLLTTVVVSKTFPAENDFIYWMGGMLCYPLGSWAEAKAENYLLKYVLS